MLQRDDHSTFPSFIGFDVRVLVTIRFFNSTGGISTSCYSAISFKKRDDHRCYLNGLIYDNCKPSDFLPALNVIYHTKPCKNANYTIFIHE